MINQELFEKIKDKYGYVASWAIWDEAGEKPKSNINNMDIFESKSYKEILPKLNVNVVMVGLNFSRDIKFEKPFMNFHDSNPHANDFKIRYAFKDTPLYGAYMTDIIKNLAMVSSKDVLKYLKQNPQIIEENINYFRDELRFIQSNKPIIIAFGSDTFDILQKYLKLNEYSHLVKVTHYSHQISKENYQKEVYSQLQTSMGFILSLTEFLLSAEDQIQKYISIITKLDKVTGLEEKAALVKTMNITNIFYELLKKLEDT